MKRSVFVAVPCYTGQIEITTANSIMRARDEAAAMGWGCAVEFQPLNCYLPLVRNILVAKFIKSGMTDLVFWDGDIAAAPGGFARLLSHRVDVVAAAYRWRKDPEGYALQSAKPITLSSVGEDGLIQLDGVPAGFLRITRAAVDRMTAHFPDLWATDQHHEEPFPWLFDCELGPEHRYHGEDFVFCRRFREAGGKVYVDPHIPIFHTGPKTFYGKFVNYLRRDAAARTPASELDAARERLAEKMRALDWAWPAVAGIAAE